MATLSTHVLDIATGRPAAGVAVTLADAAGEVIGEAMTDADGRVRPLGGELAAGDYRLTFATGDYFAGTGERATAVGERATAVGERATAVGDRATAVGERATAVGAGDTATGVAAFHPRVTVEFTVTAAGAAEHYHVPLLVSPFGYTTYRGS